MTKSKPILCLDFDGVIHSYSSGWKGAAIIPDEPVPGAIAFILRAIEHFAVAIYSSRSGQPNGVSAMRVWLRKHMAEAFRPMSDNAEHAHAIVYNTIQWPTEKPPAMVTIDDRAITFTGEWPDIAVLLAFQPWNKKPPAEGSDVRAILQDTAGPKP